MNFAQQIRAEILQPLYALRGSPIPVPIETIHRYVRRAGLHATLEEVRAEVLFHLSAGHIEAVPDPATGVNFYRITAPGVTVAELS